MTCLFSTMFGTHLGRFKESVLRGWGWGHLEKLLHVCPPTHTPTGSWLRSLLGCWLGHLTHDLTMWLLWVTQFGFPSCIWVPRPNSPKEGKHVQQFCDLPLEVMSRYFHYTLSVMATMSSICVQGQEMSALQYSTGAELKSHCKKIMWDKIYPHSHLWKMQSATVTHDLGDNREIERQVIEEQIEQPTCALKKYLQSQNTNIMESTLVDSRPMTTVSIMNTFANMCGWSELGWWRKTKVVS